MSATQRAYEAYQENKRAFCETHTKYVGVDQWGNSYSKCYSGYRNEEECKLEEEVNL